MAGFNKFSIHTKHILDDAYQYVPDSEETQPRREIDICLLYTSPSPRD